MVRPQRQSPVPKPLAPGEAELRAFVVLMERLAPEERPVWSALLNALLVAVETAPVHQAVVQGIRDALVACSTNNAQATGMLVDEHVNSLASSVSSWPSHLSRTAVQQEGGKFYSLGAEAIRLVAQLRFGLGLSMLYVHRHLHSYLGLPTPAGPLLGCIASVEPPSQDSTSRRALTP